MRLLLEPLPRYSSARQRRSNARRERLTFFTVAAIGLLIAAVGVLMAGPWFPLAFAILMFASLAIFIKPILGVYLTVFFALIGDSTTTGWYPFGLNFSSAQSILYLHDSLTISPIEVYLAITTLAWLAQLAGSRNWRLHGRPLLLPMATFVLCLFGGLVWGLFIRGGDTTVAVWELRPLLYLPLTYLLVSNLFTRTRHYMWLFGCAITAISIQNVLAIQYYFALDSATAGDLEGLTEHSASIHYDWMFMLLIGALTLRSCTPRLRILVGIATVPTMVTFVLSQRRAAVVALGVGVLVYFLIVFVRQRKTFFVLFPLVTITTTGYTLAFWNSSSGVGFGARAIKTVVAPEALTERDANSNLYRVLENINLAYTVRNNPLLGVGFGRPFDRPAPMPDISSFVFHEYIPHNSILWIWLKTGYIGFVALLVIIAFVLRAGTRATLTLPKGNLLAITVAGLAYIVMFLVFAFVDIAWESRSTLFLGSCMALCTNIVRLWQAETSPAPPEPESEEALPSLIESHP